MLAEAKKKLEKVSDKTLALPANLTYTRNISWKRYR
jgi:hypothetical protein